MKQQVGFRLWNFGPPLNAVTTVSHHKISPS